MSYELVDRITLCHGNNTDRTKPYNERTDTKKGRIWSAATAKAAFSESALRDDHQQ